MNAQLQIELNTLIRKLDGLADMTRRERNGILSEAAGPLQAAIAGRAPVGDAPHYRYSTPKLNNRLKAPKGMGNIVATYTPGNLRSSVQILKFRRSKAVFVGPKVQRSAKTPDGYYAHMVNAGTIHQGAQRFVEAGVAAAGDVAQRMAINLMKRKIEVYATQNGMK